LNHASDLVLAGAAGAGDRFLDDRGWIRRHAQTGKPDDRERHPSRLRERETAPRVLAVDEHVLDSDDRGRELVDHLTQAARDLTEALFHRATFRRGQDPTLDVRQGRTAVIAVDVDDTVAAYPAAGVEPENSHALTYSTPLTPRQMLALPTVRATTSALPLGVLRAPAKPGLVITSAALASCMVSILLGVGHAQPRQRPADKAEADRLFEEGRTLLDEGKRDEACARFEQSFRLDPRAVGTMLNLGLCREEVGLVASAVRYYGEARDRAHDQGLAEHEEAAARKIAMLSPRVPRLTLTVPAGLGVKARVLLDDDVIPLNQVDGILVDPGPHTLVVTEPGKLPFETKVTLAESQKETIAIPLLEGAKTVVVREEASPRILRGKITAVSGAALGLAGIGLGFYARSYYWDQFPAASREGQVVERDGAHPCWTSRGTAGALVRNCSKLGSTRIDRARLLGHVSTAVTIAGGVAVVSGLVVWLTAPAATERTQVDVAISGGGATFAFTRAF
jgi:hypothetical protein